MDHSRRFLLVSLLAAIVSLPTGTARGEDKPATKPTTTTTTSAADPAEVESLFKQLSDADFKTRESARKKLIDLGDDAAAQIKALGEKTGDPEARASVAAILNGIEANSTRGPTLLTLDFTETSPQDIIAEITKQSHADIGYWPDSLFRYAPMKDKRVTVKAKREPFWKVVREFLPQAGLSLRSMGGDQGLKFMQGGGEAMNGMVFYDGPFMVVATEAYESNRLSFGNDGAKSSSVSINLQFFIEPKVRVIGRSYNPVVEEFLDEAGNSLRNPNIDPSNAEVQSQSREQSFQMSVGFTPSKDGKKQRTVAKLRGHVPVLVQTKMETIEIPDLTKAKGVEIKKGGWKLVVNDLAEAGGVQTLRMEIARENPAKPQPNRPFRADWRDNLNAQNMKVLDAQGRVLPKSGSSTSGNNYTYRCEFRYDTRNGQFGPPAKLEWTFPVEAELAKIPFEFKDLPLP